MPRLKAMINVGVFKKKRWLNSHKNIAASEDATVDKKTTQEKTSTKTTDNNDA